MSQEQPKREDHQEEGIKYGDVQGDLRSKPVAPAESQMLGKTQKGGAAAAMQSAATKNGRDGVVGHNGVSVTETDAPGRQVTSDSVGEQVYIYILYSGQKTFNYFGCLFS